MITTSWRTAALQFLLIALAGVAGSSARATDAGTCVRAMPRQTFDYQTPSPRDRDPRGSLPVQMTSDQRRELHNILWPSDFSVRFSVSHWLDEQNFDCIQEAFDDLEQTQARYPAGSLKVVSLLGATRDFAAHQRGLTEAEISDLFSAWRSRYPQSLLAEVMRPRMLIAAAWVVRGDEYADKVSPERLREFRRLNNEAMKLVRGFSPAARQHVLGHYVALRAMIESGATKEQRSTFALEALRRFPAEVGLAMIAGLRLQPQWGGSPAEFERFAVLAMDAVGPSLASRTYAALYVSVVGLTELHNYPMAQDAIIKAGLLDSANTNTFEDIVALQEFACSRRDAVALRAAQARWAEYASQPQLRAPATDLDSRCRDWQRSLPASGTPDPIPGPRPGIAALAAPPLSFDSSLYRVDEDGWRRSRSPVGEVFDCTVCEYPTQILVAVGPPLDPLADATTNEQFMAALRARNDRAQIARAHLARAAQIDPAADPDRLTIETTDFAELAGVVAFRYESTIRLARRTLRETAYELIHRGRMVRLSINRIDGPIGLNEREAVLAFVGGLKLVDP